MGLNDPIGVGLEFWGVKGKIIGLVEDFHIQPLRQKIEPLIIRIEPEQTYQILVKTEVGKTTEALATLEEAYYQFNPKREFDYQFMDDAFDEQYKSEYLVKDLSFYFTVVAIVISCLGLFALVAYSAEQRTKEIGIRKVLGAGIANIFQLLSRDYIKLLFVAMIIAIPLAYEISRDWLSKYEYRIGLEWWLFALAIGLTWLISYTIIGSHVLRSATTNPVDSLRDE